MQKLVIKDLRKNFENKEVLNGASKTFEKGKIYVLVALVLVSKFAPKTFWIRSGS